ncbi:MAG: 30S ribosomal protein S21 [Candidatus Azambacteria bacterium]|nr:30S ribosomal protein S21 [Candidatus Azambacteria bacterium]
MAIGVKKRDNESIQSLLRRFSKRVQQSGILIRTRRSRFYVPPLTKRQKKISALKRLDIQKERKKLYKLGKLEHEFKRYNKRGH